MYESMSVRTHGRRSFCMVFFSLSLHMNLEVTGDLCSCFFRSAFLFRGEERKLNLLSPIRIYFSSLLAYYIFPVISPSFAVFEIQIFFLAWPTRSLF